MKRNTFLKSITVSVALSAFLAGCGSTATPSNSGDSNDDSKKSTTISGKAIDGYLQFATVCLDMDQDGYCQATEPSTQTDEDGKFTLAVSADVQKSENYDLAMLLVYGGKDVDTGDDFKGKLLAPKDGNIVMVTPVNTLIAKAVQKELKAHPKLTKDEIKEKIREHRKRVAQALDIPEDEISEDPVKLQREGKPQAIEKALQLQKAVEALMVGNNGTQEDHERADNIYDALVDGLADMDQQETGVDALLNKTLQKAKSDTKIRELLGGAQGVKLGGAAKKVAQNIKERFKKFKESNPDELKHEDFLKKIAIGTDLDLHKVEIAFDDGSKEDQIAGQITITDDSMFQPNFDWDAEFIKKDLFLIGEKEPTPELIGKIKALFQGHEKIRPGILMIKKERLAHSEDPAIQDLYKKIERFAALKQKKHEEEQAKRSDAVVKIQTPMTIFTPEEDGYGKITFGADNKLSFQKYKVQNDGTFAPETNDNQDNDMIFQNGQWIPDEDGSEQYTLGDDGAISLPKWNEKAYLITPKEPVAGKSKKFPQYHTAITMPDDAKMYFIKIKKMKDTYTLNQEVQKYQQNSNPVPYTSISDFIETQCETRWFEGDENGGIAFAGEQTETGYSCDGTQTSGKLVFAKNVDNETEIVNEDAGTWEIKTLEGNTKVLVVKPYNMKRFHDDEGDISYPIFAMNQGTLYRGDMEPAGITRAIPAFNESAMNAITDTITTNWSDIIKEMPVNDFKKRYNQ